MVSGAFKYVRKKPISFTSTQRSTERSCWKVKSTRNTEFTATSGLQPRPQSSFKKIALAPHDYAGFNKVTLSITKIKNRS